ncbi:laccase-3-like [Patiria miniata]|uniref:Laccase n=1 Tax=Patiria miniata TaxID=46514 RepID=A0A913Z1Q9_PATMI|nr:laccase-3-like [Patiria miniata]
MSVSDLNKLAKNMMRCVTVIVVLAVLGTAMALRPADEHPCYRSCDVSIPMTCTYNWTLNWFYTLAQPQCGDCPVNITDCSNPDCFPADGVKRPVSLVNRVFPAPSIQICSGDEVIINVANKMLNDEGVTLHWHGIFQNGSQFMDGLPMVTQCPIPSPGNFQYRFTPYEPGTHWFHSHAGLQRADGMMGSFVIRESSRADPHGDLYDLDLSENVIFMNDWHHDTMVNVYTRDQWGGGSSVASILINGKGLPVGNSAVHPPLEVFNVLPGQRYRFRVINGASFFCNMQFSIQGHSMLVIASDGGSMQPLEVDYFRISGGERIDFVLSTDQPIDNYQIQVIGLPCTNEQGEPSKQIAYLRYMGANDLPTIDELPNITSYGNSSFWWQAFPDKSFADVYASGMEADYRSTANAEDHQEYIQVSFGSHINPSTQQPKLYPQLNNITYYFPTSPVMSQFEDLPGNIFCKESDFAPGQCDGDDICSCVHTIDVNPNEVIEVILVNPDSHFSVLHPMHLHGQQFKVVAMDKIEGATVDMVRELVNNGSIVRNNNGPRKDVTIVPNGGYTIFQFQGWNPGWWIFHCHIEFHLEEGMGLLFNVKGNLPSVPKAFPTCGVWPPAAPTDDEGAEPPVSETSTASPAGTNGDVPCRSDPQTGSSPLVHLAWIVPLTFVLALVLGLVIGKCVLGKQRTGSADVSIAMHSAK